MPLELRDVNKKQLNHIQKNEKRNETIFQK